jgi:hypothetical protein
MITVFFNCAGAKKVAYVNYNRRELKTEIQNIFNIEDADLIEITNVEVVRI